MDEELFELCKEVYERFPEWEPKDRYLMQFKDNPVSVWSWSNAQWMEDRTPLYTSDYLLEKLPPTVVARGESFSTATRVKANAPLIGEESDTPLKALLKLTLALDDAGVKL